MTTGTSDQDLLIGVGGIFAGLVVFAIGVVLHVQIGQLAPAHPEVGDAVMFIGLGIAIVLPGWSLVAKPLLSAARDEPSTEPDGPE